MNTLIIQHKNERLNTTHVGFIPFMTQLCVVYGAIKDGKFSAVSQQDFGYVDNPELRAVTDGIGWDLTALLFLLEEAERALEVAAVQNH